MRGRVRTDLPCRLGRTGLPFRPLGGAVVAALQRRSALTAVPFGLNGGRGRAEFRGNRAVCRRKSLFHNKITRTLFKAKNSAIFTATTLPARKNAIVAR